MCHLLLIDPTISLLQITQLHLGCKVKLRRGDTTNVATLLLLLLLLLWWPLLLLLLWLGFPLVAIRRLTRLARRRPGDCCASPLLLRLLRLRLLT